MSELLKKYESIDQSKLSEATIKILNRVKTITADFTADDAKNNDIAEKVMNEILKKNPDAVKIVKREPKAKPAPKKTHKAKGTHKAKATHKATPAPATKTSNNNIMSVAKEIQKTGESWKDAMERAKQVLKERKEENVQKGRTEMEKLLALVRTKKELQGFANSDIKRDSVRTSKVKGSRVVTREGFTSNQYAQNVPNKLGRKYWESRENRSDRLAPNYQKDMPLLARGGVLPDEYVRTVRWADGNYRVEKKTKQNDFGHTFNDVFEDVSKAESFAKKIAENNKLNYIGVGTMPYDFRKSNLPEKEFLEEYYKKNKFAEGGSFAPNVADGTQFMDGVYAKGGSVKKGAVKVGVFSSEDLKTNVFEKALAKKSEETGLTKIDLIAIKKGGETFIELYLIPNSESAKDVLIKDWYTKTYPTDDLGEELNDSVTFEDLWNEDYKKYNIYQVMGVGDSLIRERLFERLAEIKGVDYDVVYKKLFSSDGFYANGGSFAPNVSDGTAFMNGVYADGGSVTNERMFNFLKDDLGKLEKANNEGNYEEVGRFFSYWLGSSGHLKSLKTEKNDRMYNFLKDDLEKLENSINNGEQEQVDMFFSYWGQHLGSLKMADGGIFASDTSAYLTDPTFGDFQNTGMFDDGGSLITETVSAIFNPNQKSGKIETGFGSKTKEGLFAMMTNVNYSPEEITTAVFVPNAKKGRIYTEFGVKTKEGLHEMVENMRNTFEHGGSMANLTEQEFLKKYFGANVFTENPSQYFEIKKMSSDDDAKVNAFVKELKADGFTVKKRAYSDFTSVMGVKKKGSFAKGGKAGMKAQQGQINDLKKYIPLANKENVEILAEAGNDNGDTFRGSFVAKYGKQNFRIENGKLVRKFELGGAFMMTDLAGHTGGSDGLGNPMPLSGVSGTHYTGLVGETGAMSSGELFEAGGSIQDNLKKRMAWADNKAKKSTDIYLVLQHKKDKNEIVGITKHNYLRGISDWKDWNVVYFTEKNSYELGGAFVMTDLAGHTGGSDGLGNPMPLSGVSGTHYTGLVGETGAMSSGEMFMDGGALMVNQQVINDASQPYVITEAFGNPAQHLAKGGTIVNQYEGRTPEDVWNNLTIEQRKHFLHDHNNLIVYYISTDPKVKSGTLISELYSPFKSKSLNYSKLNKFVKQVFEEHIETGQYAYGGKTKSRQSMRELYIEQIANTTNTRAVGVNAFANEHSLTDSELSNLMTGLGRGMVTRADFVTALSGEKNNTTQKEVVAFAKSDKAYKMADGGSFAPNVADGTEFMDNAYFADGGTINGMLNKKIQKLAEKKGLTTDGLGRDEYNKAMTQAVVESLTDANFHDEAKQVVVKAEGKTKWSDDLYQAESFNPDTEVASFAREVARTCEWDGDDILNAYYFITKMQGSKVAGMIDDLFLNPKPTQSSSKPTKYIDHDDIESVTLNVNGNFVTFAGKDFLNGANLMEKGGDLSKIATYFPKRDIVKVTLKNGDTIKPLNGYWLKKGSEPMGKKNTGTPPKTGKVTSPNYPDVNFNHKVVINGRTIHLALAKSYKTGLDDSKQYDFIDVDGNPMTGYGYSVKEALKQIEEYGNDPIYSSKNTPPKIDETKAHFKMDIVSGGKFEVFVDSNFVNQSQNNLPNTELKHYGFGDFYLQTPDGNIDFIRTSEEKQGFVGRTHKMKGSDELVLKLVDAMKEKGRFESTQTFKRGGRVSVNFGGHKSKENWGKNDLYEMYANSIDLDADLADYFKDYEKDFGTEQAEEEKKRLVETLKAGKIKYNDGASLTFADGGAIGSGKNGYVAFYKGKQIDVYADTKYQAQKTASQHFKARKEYDVNVVLAELDGKPYVNDTMFADGGSFAPNVADGTQFMNGVYANGGETQGNNIDAELEDFDLDNLDPFETMQYNNFVKSLGKVGALQVLINTVEGDYSQLSPALAELAEMQMSSEEYNEATRQMRFERDGYANGGGVSGKLESGAYRVGKPTKVSANLYEQKIVEIFDNGDISTASDYGRKLGDFKSQKYPIITKEQLENQYKMADGGSTGSGFDPVKVKVVLAVGLDRAIEFYNADYPIRPYQLLERGVRGGYITLDEINERVVESAMETAQDSEDMDEVGSSDFGAYLRDFLDEAGFKVGYVNGRLTREYADGGSFAPNVADGTQFMNNVYADGGEVRRFNRHEQMDSETREEVLDVVSEPQLKGSLTNYLYGLYDGYDYSETENFKKEMNKLKSKDLAMYDRINAIYKKIDKYKFEQYDDFANGGSFAPNVADGTAFMDNAYFADGGELSNYTVTIVYPRLPLKGERSNWAYNENVDLDVLAKNETEAKKKALVKFSEMFPNEKPSITSVNSNKYKFLDNSKLENGGSFTPKVSDGTSFMDNAYFAKGGSLNVMEQRELRTFVNSLFNRAKNKISNDKGNSLFVVSATVNAMKGSLGNPTFYLGVKKIQKSRPTYVVGSGFLSSDMLVYESYKKDSRFLETESIVEAKKFLTEKVKRQILHLKDKGVLADGGMFDDNDGFMRVDNDRNFRYPEMEVYVETFDEPIDLTSNISSNTNNVVIRPLDEAIDLNEDGRIRAKMSYNPAGRTPQKMMAVNPRMVVTDLPMPTSHTHKND